MLNHATPIRPPSLMKVAVDADMNEWRKSASRPVALNVCKWVEPAQMRYHLRRRFMPPCSGRSCIPKAALSPVPLPEIRDILGVVGMPGKIVDPPGKMLAGLEMAGGVAVTLVFGGIE